MAGGLLDFLSMIGNPSRPHSNPWDPDDDERFAPIGPASQGLLGNMPQRGMQAMPGATPPMSSEFSSQGRPSVPRQDPFAGQPRGPVIGLLDALGLQGSLGSGGLLGGIQNSYGGPDRMRAMLGTLDGSEQAMAEYLNPGARNFDRWYKMQQLKNEQDKLTKPEMVEIFDPDKGQPRKMERVFQNGQWTLKPIGGVKEQEAPKLSFEDITKLTTEGSKFTAINRFVDTFKPEFAGFTVTGGFAPWAGRILAGDSAALEGVARMTGRSAQDIKGSADYWQEYDRYKNIVRNELFGSALTPGERAAFEQADINPQMDPETIKRNLARQQEVLQGAMRRKAGGMVDQGFKPDAIAKAYGVPLEQLGVTPKGQPQGSMKLPQGVTREQALAEAQRALAQAKTEGQRAAIQQRLKSWGF